jgi:hypothetical protein
MRHQTEREELLRWEERNFYRNSSLETVREGIITPVPVPDMSDVEITSLSRNGNPGRPKRKLFEIGDGDGTDSDALTSEYGSGRESDNTSSVEDSLPKRFRSRRDEPYVTVPHINRANTDLGEEIEMQQGEAEGSSGCVISPKDEDTVMVQVSMDRLCETPNSSRSASISPDSRESSVLSVPSSESELETESEDGYASLSAESSSWEMVDSGDNFGACIMTPE